MSAYLNGPLSVLYSADFRAEIERLRRSELNVILARHRMNHEAHRLADEAERLNPIKVSLS
jgi:hypothetical protein